MWPMGKAGETTNKQGKISPPKYLGTKRHPKKSADVYIFILSAAVDAIKLLLLVALFLFYFWYWFLHVGKLFHGPLPPSVMCL